MDQPKLLDIAKGHYRGLLRDTTQEMSTESSDLQ